ncbi:hypothetical protein OBBRIDRAFT_634532 [Obba rivulosa]|uniref:DUF6533 domain-containing protein n=1 Tax=Obba rivulosa TaxID=1052685 RepID=A0A8E2DK11_9APHY|nr:hypothetical protein OBBRIDRAFT_634532 [Obba rivulosa]
MLVSFDHICTLPSEIMHMWGRRWTGVTVLFDLNAWTTIAYYKTIFLTVDFLSLPSPSVSNF